jgi:hypothetical protein
MEAFTMPLRPFCVYSGLSETTVRDLINHGEIDSVVVNKRRLVIVPSYHRLVERRQAEAPDARRNDTVPAFGARHARGPA